MAQGQGDSEIRHPCSLPTPQSYSSIYLEGITFDDKRQRTIPPQCKPRWCGADTVSWNNARVPMRRPHTVKH